MYNLFTLRHIRINQQSSSIFVGKPSEQIFCPNIYFQSEIFSAQRVNTSLIFRMFGLCLLNLNIQIH